MTAMLKRYNTWADTLEFNRLLVMAIIIMVHSCLIIPPVLLLMLHGEAGILPYIVITFFSFLILVTNLAVMPARVTVGVFLISSVAHLMIIAYYLMA